ncbi:MULTISPECIES: 5'-nucleotidase C-terminal domain-containing protein [Sphingobacterium]|uniref:5'-nucleotidase C-terminal domain-containing protein n=1 Tax=Sphingobacterium tenebrionis TaxID=3111775 RepID=A0ABU8I9A2_9SPHI|nr:MULTISPECIES: 5'-nucleotidase C-terminal domain-containing protein [unclassified Sphingobacterium]
MKTWFSTYNLLFLSVGLLALSSCKTTYYQSTVSNKQMIAINNSIVEDTAISNYINPYRTQLEAKMNEVIGISTENMIHNRNLPESLLSNFFVDAMMGIGRKIDPEVDFSMATKDGIRSNIKAGDITVGTIFEFMPFENLFVVLELKGSDVLRLADFIAESNGQPIGNAQILIKDKKLQDFKIAGKNIDPNKTYKLITYDFIANGGDHVRGLENPVKKTTSTQLVREGLIDYIQGISKSGKKIESKLDGRVKIIQ